MRFRVKDEELCKVESLHCGSSECKHVLQLMSKFFISLESNVVQLVVKKKKVLQGAKKIRE